MTTRLQQLLKGKKRGDVIVGTVGEEARGVAVGKNIIQIGTVVIPTLPVLALVLLLAAVALVSIMQPWRPRGPKKMTGEFNVAVAEFQVIGDGKAEDIYNVAQVFYERLNVEIVSLSERLQVVEARGPKPKVVELRGPVETGLISGNTPEKRWEGAEKLAQDIGADVVIYGTVEVEDRVMRVSPEFYVNRKSFCEAEEVVGQHRMGASIDVDPLFKWETNWRLSARSRALSLVVIGLSYYAIDNYEAALGFFKEAGDIEGWDEGKEVLYAFLGYSALRQGSITDAREYCKQARDLNKEYSRAYICIGDVLYIEALGDRTSYKTVKANLLEEAIDTFKLALEAEEQPPGADVPTKVNLALGQAYLVKAHLVKEQVVDGDYLDFRTQAEEMFEAVIAEYGSGPPSRSYRLQEVASHAYAHLGLIYRLRGENQEAIPRYKQAVELTRTPERKALYAARLGDIYLALEDNENAILWYERAVHYEPERSDKREKYKQTLSVLTDPQLEFPVLLLPPPAE